jgi:hypothetical protein
VNDSVRFPRTKFCLRSVLWRSDISPGPSPELHRELAVPDYYMAIGWTLAVGAFEARERVAETVVLVPGLILAADQSRRKPIARLGGSKFPSNRTSDQNG